MGSAFSTRSKKIIDYQQHTKVSNFSCSTTSSERTMVETNNSLSTRVPPNRTTELPTSDKKRKPSILPNNNFFNNIRLMGRATNIKEKKVRHQHFHHPVNMNNSSLSRRKPPRSSNNNKRKKAVTKSIIGRPTNFKHLNTSTDFDHMHILNDNDEEAAKVAAQMIILSTLIKPLPVNDDIKIPVIPSRSSSYGNSVYLEENPVKPLSKVKAVAATRKTKVSSSSSIKTSSIKKSKKKVVGMNNHGSIPSRSSIAAHNKQRAAVNRAAAAKKKVY